MQERLPSSLHTSLDRRDDTYIMYMRDDHSNPHTMPEMFSLDNPSDGLKYLMRSGYFCSRCTPELDGFSERRAHDPPLAMGRTFRHRRLKKRVGEARPVSLQNEDSYLKFVKWLSCQRWKPTCKLTPVHFLGTGRGMMAKENIEAHTVLASLPAEVLITVQTVANSVLGSIFLSSDKVFSTQQILSAFLVWEKHLGTESFWFPYLNILPTQYFSPVFCPNRVIDAFPKTISDKIHRMKLQIDELHALLIEEISVDKCVHCDKSYDSIFSFNEFEWAWFTVNSRSVYLSPDVNDSCNINLSDNNSLALAPFLDMINHTDKAEVNVLFDEKNGLYSIVTLVPYKKNQEVFINYGGHSNEKLYLEYGFVLPTNRNDCVTFTHEEFFKAVQLAVPQMTQVAKNRYNFLKSHGFLTDLNCSHDGLSWNARALIYVLLEPPTVELGDILKTVYSASFRLPPRETMYEILGKLFSPKIFQLGKHIELLKELSELTGHCPVTVGSGIELLKKYIILMETILSHTS